jgi:hypothetical protein
MHGHMNVQFVTMHGHNNVKNPDQISVNFSDHCWHPTVSLIPV